MADRRYKNEYKCKRRGCKESWQNAKRRISVHGKLYGRASGGKIAFATTMPGVVLPIDLRGGKTIIAQKGAFLCAEHAVELSVTLTKKFSAGLFGGEGFILQKMSGEGTVFLEVDGDVVERELYPGEVIKVDTGNVVAFEQSVKYEIETVKGLGNIFFGGEGLFLTRLTGPGKVILQTLNIGSFIGMVAGSVRK